MDANIKESLPEISLDLQSFLMLKAGLKPVVRLGFKRNKDSYDEVAKKLGIVLKIKRFKKLYWVVLGNPVEVLYAGLSGRLIEEAYNAEVNRDMLALGKLLGYPECCVKNFVESLDTEKDFMVSALKRTKKNPSFFCNGIFNIESKWSCSGYSFKKDEQIFSDFNKLFLIKHIPHSLDCQESIKIGKKTLELLEKESPEFAKEIVEALQKPVLYFNYFDWLVFKGKVKDQELIYEEVILNRSYSADDKIKKIRLGNRLKVSDKKIIIYKDRKVIGELAKKNEDDGLLIDFK